MAKAGDTTGEVLSIILAGGKGSRLHDLTDHEAKPALPIGRNERLIDYTLANVVNSGLGDAFVLTQHAPAGLCQHIRQNWAGDSRRFPVLDGRDHGGFLGTADAVAKVRARIDAHKPRHVVILAGDHLYQMDYRPFIERHKALGAAVTVGVVHVPVAEATGFGVLAVDAGHRITAFVEKPAHPPEALDRPGQALASMGIYVFDWLVLKALLRKAEGRHTELDFGKHILPELVAGGEARAYALPGRGEQAPLWQDLGTLDAYHSVQRQFDEGTLVLDPRWPVAPFAAVSGNGRPAVGVGSALRNVVVLPGARIGCGASLSDAIVMGDAVVPDGFDLDQAMARHGGWCRISEGGIRLLSGQALGRLMALENTRPNEIGGPLGLSGQSVGKGPVVHGTVTRGPVSQTPLGNGPAALPARRDERVVPAL